MLLYGAVAMVTGGKDVEMTFYRLFENIHVLQWQQFGVFRVEYIFQENESFMEKCIFLCVCMVIKQKIQNLISSLNLEFHG